MRIPEPRDGKVFFERLRDPVCLSRRFHAIDRRILVEPPRSDCAHAITPDELIWLLRVIDEPALDQLTLFVFRQPTRKQELLHPVWGRMAFNARIAGEHGPALILEACNLEREIRWSRSLIPDDARELDRLRADGHLIRTHNRGFTIVPSLAAARRTQLRVILHELGHWVDWKRHDKKLGYWQRASVERERFANRYADELATKLRARGRMLDTRDPSLDPRREAGLDPRWFQDHSRGSNAPMV